MFGGFSINSADTRAKLLWDNSSFHLFASERLPVCLIHLYRAKPRSPINSWEFCHWLLHDQGLACSKGKKKRRKLEAASPSGEWQAAHHLRATAWTKAGEQGAVLWAHIGLTLPWLPGLPGDAMPCRETSPLLELAEATPQAMLPAPRGCRVKAEKEWLGGRSTSCSSLVEGALAHRLN